MRTRNLIKSLGGALVVAVLAFSSSANADIVTQLIHFDDASNGWKWYSDADNNFLFDPTNLSNSTLCADTTQTSGSENGICVLENTQDGLPLMTRPADGPSFDPPGPDPFGEGQGSANQDPVTARELLPLNLDAFNSF